MTHDKNKQLGKNIMTRVTNQDITDATKQLAEILDIEFSTHGHKENVMYVSTESGCYYIALTYPDKKCFQKYLVNPKNVTKREFLKIIKGCIEIAIFMIDRDKNI